MSEISFFFYYSCKYTKLKAINITPKSAKSRHNSFLQKKYCGIVHRFYPNYKQIYTNIACTHICFFHLCYSAQFEMWSEQCPVSTLKCTVSSLYGACPLTRLYCEVYNVQFFVVKCTVSSLNCEENSVQFVL